MGLQVDITKKLKDMTLRVAFDTSKSQGITGILGASGCGKSMTLKCIAGIERPDQGRIVLNGRVLFDSEKGIHLPIQERRVGYLFQDYALFPHMTVRENVEIALPGSKQEKREKALQYLSLFRVDGLAEHYPSRLSGGQQQRVALARIMASKPDVLMLDEPFSALDYYLKEKLQLELKEELGKYGGDVLLVTHNRDEIYRLCSQIYVINEGQVVSSGTVKDVFREPGTVSAAKLTGCKNIVEIRYRNPHLIYVPEWETEISVQKREVPKDASHMGIRAHYLRAAHGQETVNTMACRLEQLVDDPFEVTLILDNGIWWKIPKGRWNDEFREMVPERMVVPEESIFFLEDR